MHAHLDIIKVVWDFSLLQMPECHGEAKFCTSPPFVKSYMGIDWDQTETTNGNIMVLYANERI